jgi:8-oxo-dGTP pyrophosphatase MutT (NUDIX family)
VKREVMEEIGLDLNSDDYIQVGKLNEREITSIKDNKLLMILVPFGKCCLLFDKQITLKKQKVYLQVVPESPIIKLQESEVAAVQCNYLL